MKNNISEHKKGVKAIKYSKKPQPLVGPDALKKKAKMKPSTKTELEKHSNLTSKLKESDTMPPQTAEKKKQIRQAVVDYNKSPGQKTTPPSSAAKAQIRKDVKDIGQEIYKEGSVKDKLYKNHQELRKKSGLPNPEYYKELKGTFDLPDDERHSKVKELKKKYNVNMKETKQSDITKPRNFVAKNAKTVGAGKHKDAKKASKEIRGQKHKNKEMAESYEQARAARIRYALMLQEGEWDQQSDEMIPPEYDMDPAELKAIRNAEFTEQDKIQAMIKLSAGGTSDAEIAKIYDMDKETVASILDDYIEEIEAEMEPDDEVKEAEMGKIIDYKPGQTATLNTGPGMTTILDLKKNPTSLTKDPATGKLKLVGPQAQGTPSATSTQPSTIKAGDAVEIGKTTEDLLRLAGLR